MHLDELDTPHLLVDLDGLEDNLDRYQAYFSEHGIGLRPHIKTHKCLAIAHMQMARGAMGALVTDRLPHIGHSISPDLLCAS